MQGLNAMGAGPQAANPYLQAMGGAGMPQGLAAQSMQRGFTDYMRDPQAGQAALQAATPSTQQVPQSGISGGDIAKAGLGMLSGGPYATGGGFAGGDATNAIAQNPILAAQRARQQQAQAAGAPRQGGGGGPATPAGSQVPQRRLRPQFMPSQMPMAGGGAAGPPAPGNQSAMMRILQMMGGNAPMALGGMG